MNDHPLSNAWIVFRHRGQELTRISAAEATGAEVLETARLLAHDRACSTDEIELGLAEAIRADGPPAVPGCFFDYWNTADYLLELLYALTLHEAGVDSPEIAAARDAGETPVAFVTRFARKHDLTPVTQWSPADGRRALSGLVQTDAT